MNRIRPAVVLFLCLPILAGAQTPSFLSGSPFSGVNAIGFNPAALAGSKVTLDLALGGAEASASNNYVGINRHMLMNSVLFNDEPLDTARVMNNLQENLDGRDKALHLNASVWLPSFTATFDNGHGFGTHARLKTMTQITGVPQSLAKLAFEGFNYPQLWGLELHSEDLEVLTNSWAEYGFTYAGLISGKEHTVKLGATLKLIQGLGAAYVELNDLSFTLQDLDTVGFLQTTASYAHSDNLDYANGTFSYRLNTPVSAGMDLGMVYEYRPGGRRDYIVSLGIAMIDAGATRYDKGRYAQDFLADVSMSDVQALRITSFESLADSVQSLYTVLPSDDYFVVQLPTHINISVDYNIGRGFGLNATASVASLAGSPSVYRLLYPSSLAFMPRYENKWIGVYMPVSVDHFYQLHCGLGVRFGPLTVGSGDILNWIGKHSVYGLDAAAYFKITIPARNRERKPKHAPPAAKIDCPVSEVQTPFEHRSAG